MSILSAFDTRDLLPLVVVSHRFHSLILRILHFRLLLAAALPDYKLILEAYHPSKRYSDPYLFCTYLGTDGLSAKHEGEGSLYEDCAGPGGRFAKLGSLYSRFRPEKPNVRGPMRRTAGTTQPLYANAGDGGNGKVIHTLTLDAEELFAQFCAYASLVRLGPRRGVFLSTVHIVESGQGVMRVWREWLQDRARESRDREANPAINLAQFSTTTTYRSIRDDKNIMWTDYRRNVGLRVAIRDLDGTSQDDRERLHLGDMSMSFSIEIQGKFRQTQTRDDEANVW